MMRKMITSIFLATSLSVMAADSIDTDDYFQALKQIKEPPIGSVPILACDSNEKKRFLDLMKKSDIKDFTDLKLDEDGKISARWDDQIEIYKGDFSNEGMTEYALITTGGTMHANTVYIYKLISDHLVNVNLNNIIITNLIPGSDMRNFYFNVADPFAIKQNGKTYLRFMTYPGGHTDYDKTKLQLCTYLWQGKQFTLTGPNWRYDKDNLVPAKDCVGSSI
jgi:hypothetical protein